MLITLSPMRRDDRLVLERHGDTLIANGTAADLSGLAEGAELPEGATGCPWILGPVRRRAGRLEVPVLLPHGPGAPAATLFPAPLDLTADGPVALPPWDGGDPAEED